MPLLPPLRSHIWSSCAALGCAIATSAEAAKPKTTPLIICLICFLPVTWPTQANVHFEKSVSLFEAALLEPEKLF